jgi:hypothetical protein
MTFEQLFRESGGSMVTIQERLRCEDCHNPRIPYEGVLDILAAFEDRETYHDILEATLLNRETDDCEYHRSYRDSWTGR